MNIAWLIIIVVVMIAVQGQIFLRLGPRKLTYQRFFNVSRCYAGEEIEMVERIANHKLLPIPWVRLESTLSADLKFARQRGQTISEGELFQNHRSLFSLMPYTQVVRRHKLVCARRGIYELSSATLTVGDLFGMFNTYRKLTMNLQLIVYPQPMLPDAAELPSHSWQGDVIVKRWIVQDPFMLAGTREYQYGDAMTDINWLATARSGRMQVNQHDFTADRRVMVLLNVEDHEKMWNQISDVALIERGISYAAGIIQEAIHAGMEAGFISNGSMNGDRKEPVQIEARGGRGHYEHILDRMARMTIVRSVPFDVLIEQVIRSGQSNLDIVVISTYVNERISTLAGRLIQNGNSLTVLPLAPTSRPERAEKEGIA